KNYICVIKDTPIIVGSAYPTLKEAVDYANANATEPTAIVIYPGDHIVDDTVEVTNINVRSITGFGATVSRLIPDPVLAGSPLIYNTQNLGTGSFALNRFSIVALTVPVYKATPGSVGMLLEGAGTFTCDSILIAGCYRNLELAGSSFL